ASLSPANEETRRLVTTQGTIEKVDRDALTLRPRGSEGKATKNLVLRLSSASRFTMLRIYKRAGEATIGQKELRPEHLQPPQEIACIYIVASPANLLLTAVVQPDAERAQPSSLPPEVPAKVATVLRHIDEHRAAPAGYEGGRTFLNLGRDGEQVLPR